MGLAPFAAGFTSFIPALEFLVAPDEGGTVRFSLTQLLLWAVVTCGLGIVAGTPFRELFIFRQRLLYPSATATGTLIGVLFKDEEAKTRAKLIKGRVSRSRLRRVSPGGMSFAGYWASELANACSKPPTVRGFSSSSMSDWRWWEWTQGRGPLDLVGRISILWGLTRPNPDKLMYLLYMYSHIGDARLSCYTSCPHYGGCPFLALPPLKTSSRHSTFLRLILAMASSLAPVSVLI